jgi:8-oxo-dGTP pyrophosphatase MutT (NUDIX family)
MAGRPKRRAARAARLARAAREAHANPSPGGSGPGGAAPFSQTGALGTLQGVPVGSVFVVYKQGGKRAFFMKSSPAGARQVVKTGFRPVRGLLDVTTNVKKGLVISLGSGIQRSAVKANAVVRAWRKATGSMMGSGASYGSSSGSSYGSSSGSSWQQGVYGAGSSSSSSPGPWAGSGSGSGSGGDGAYQAAPKVYSTGGVLINDAGEVLLRQPTNCYDGYAWTFAKGRVDEGETEKEAALREVLEETGWHADIVANIPGAFLGGTTQNVYFLMKPTYEDMAPPDPNDPKAHKGPGMFPERKYPHWETQAMRWVDRVTARKLIKFTYNNKGRTRDKQVLDAAYAVWDSLQPATDAPAPTAPTYTPPSLPMATPAPVQHGTPTLPASIKQSTAEALWLHLGPMKNLNHASTMAAHVLNRRKSAVKQAFINAGLEHAWPMQTVAASTVTPGAKGHYPASVEVRQKILHAAVEANLSPHPGGSFANPRRRRRRRRNTGRRY